MEVWSKYQKKRCKKSCLICILSFLSIIVLAQTNKKLPYLYQEKLQKADEYYHLLDYKKAVDLYQKVLEKCGEDTAIIYKIASAYKLLNDPKNAEEWYRRGIINNEKTISPILKLNFAQVLTINGKYNEALYWFKEYYKTSSASDLRAKEAITSIENISNFYYDTTFYVVYPVNINTQYSEFSPCYYKDGILFLSNKDNSKSGFLSWYFSTVDSAGNFSKPVKFGKSLKTEYNKGPVSFYDHYNKMIFGQNYIDKKNGKKSINEITLQLFSATQDNNNQWKDIQLLSFVNKSYSYAQPSVSSDEKTLYFSSNMPGGYGGTDLYMSKFNNGTWDPPINLGDKINTPGDEMFPFIFQDTLLYFSSDGHGGLGGLDIFKINLKDAAGKLSHLGVPINSANDDFGIQLDKDGLSGYFASNRQNGMGADDIYGFKIVRITLTIKIIDDNTALPVSNVEIYTADPVNEKRIGVTDREGSCTLIVPVCKSYQIRIKRENYETKIYTFESVKTAQNTLAVIPIKTESTQKGEVILTDENNKPIKNLRQVVYKVQISASRVPVAAQELNRKYSGPLRVNNFYEDNWYKYSIGEFPSYTEAKKNLLSCKVYDAFIIAYVNNKKVHITMAKTATKETDVQSPIRKKDRMNR